MRPGAARADLRLELVLVMVVYTTWATPAGSQCLLPCGGFPNDFLVRSYQGRSRCLDYTPEVVGSKVFINDCELAHPIAVEELSDGKHTVVLHAGTKIIGAMTSSAPINTTGATPVPAEHPLVLQNPVTGIVQPVLSGRQNIASQHFTLDGDSIILSASMPEPPGSSPVLVAKVQNAHGAVGTPVVLGPRALADNEFWDFEATDNSRRYPTSGFHGVTTADELWNVLHNILPFEPGGGWGSVVALSPDGSFDMSSFPAPVLIPAGVTVRGDRRGTNLGPEISGGICFAVLGVPFCTGSFRNFADAGADHMFDVQGDYVRLTGVRLRGPSRSTDEATPVIKGIMIAPSNSNMPATWTAVDHNDISDWPGVAVGTTSLLAGSPDISTNHCVSLDANAPPVAYVGRNFIHHNERKNFGYGIGAGGKVMAAGNTFLMNRHSIAADGEAHDTYTAWFNLVLSNVPSYAKTFGVSREQDFDMHGTGSGGYGGIAGDKLDIGWNTFLGGDRLNFSLRGYPCARDYFHDNVSEQSFSIGVGSGNDNDDKALFSYYSGVIKTLPRGGFAAGFDAPDVTNPYPQDLWVFANQWRDSSPPYANPTARLGVGDFDGDGTSDLFLATGRGWYYSPGGVAEWRFLSPKTEKADQLLFGDFDRDGRTDVVAIRDGYLYVSWGGISDWELLNPNPAPGAITDMAVGNFVGDQRSDIFYADGRDWYVSDAGAGAFSLVATSSFRVNDLRFGDFDGDGRTDVFGVVSGAWRVSYSAQSAWTFLRSPLTDSVANLVVADFDGDGRADVAMSTSRSVGLFTEWDWLISSGGVANWTTSRSCVAGLEDPCGPFSAAAGIGRFAGNRESDVVLWGWQDNPKVFAIVPGATGTAQRQSRQEMR